MGRFRNQLVLASTTIVLVIVLGATTGILALRSAISRNRQAGDIDHQIVMLEKIRDGTREMIASARRLVMSGDLKERQRVLAISDDVARERKALDARVTIPNGPVLEADLDAFQLTVLDAASATGGDVVERLTGFEEALARARGPLTATLDEMIARQRATRAKLRSAQSLATSAQWTLLLASSIGVMLAIGMCIAVLRHVRSSGPRPGLSPASSASGLARQPFDVTEVVDEALTAHRDLAAARGLRFRFEPQPRLTALADRERVREVLDNLLAAAIADGRPSSELTVHVGSSDGGIRIAVIEPGPANESSAADHVALLLSRQIIEAHGGRLGVQRSALSQTYWFTLPAEPSVLR